MTPFDQEQSAVLSNQGAHPTAPLEYGAQPAGQCDGGVDLVIPHFQLQSTGSGFAQPGYLIVSPVCLQVIQLMGPVAQPGRLVKVFPCQREHVKSGRRDRLT